MANNLKALNDALFRELERLEGCTGREEQRKYLYIASMSNINAAAATVRALICDEESRKK